MNLDVSAQLIGIVTLNVIALVLLVAVEVNVRRRRPEEPEQTTESTVGLDRWIEEIEEVEHRQTFASGGDFLPQQSRTVNG